MLVEQILNLHKESEFAAIVMNILQLLMETFATRKNWSSTHSNREQVAEEMTKRRMDMKKCSVEVLEPTILVMLLKSSR